MLSRNPPIDLDPIDRNIPFDLEGIFLLTICLLLIIFAGCQNPTPSYGAEINLIVKIAESQIGKGEIGGNNKGPQVKKYTLGKEVSWCAGFVSYTLRRAGHTKTDRYLLSALSYWTTYKRQRVTSPKAGDVICFYRGMRGSNTGHVGIVESVNGSKIITLQGNVGKYPARVKRITYKLNHIPHLLGFVRI